MKNPTYITIEIRKTKMNAPIERLSENRVVVYAFEQAKDYLTSDLLSILLDLYYIPDDIQTRLDELKPFVDDECVDIEIIDPDGNGHYSIFEFKEYLTTL